MATLDIQDFIANNIVKIANEEISAKDVEISRKDTEISCLKQILDEQIKSCNQKDQL